ncbi:BBE domain-containing protein [Streptomyces nigra]|uniref:BBE domain-containing protein n=1 Tax=Streptomyces nigra TaxID=1827580 RepID=UPI003690F17C
MPLPVVVLVAMGTLHMDPPTPMPYSVSVELRMLGGALDREPEVPNAVSSRGLPFVLCGFGVGAPDAAGFLSAELEEVMNAMEPWADRRRMVNFPSAQEATDSARLSEVYGAERYRRLTAAKKAYDPTHMFRVNHNIPPG